MTVLPCSTYTAHTANGSTPPVTPRVEHPGEPRHPCAPPYPLPAPSLSISLSHFILVKPRAEPEHEQSSSPFAAPAKPRRPATVPHAPTSLTSPRSSSAPSRARSSRYPVESDPATTGRHCSSAGQPPPHVEFNPRALLPPNRVPGEQHRTTIDLSSPFPGHLACCAARNTAPPPRPELPWPPSPSSRGRAPCLPFCAPEPEPRSLAGTCSPTPPLPWPHWQW